MAFGFPGVKLEGSLFLGVRGIGVSVASQYWGASRLHPHSTEFFVAVR